MLIKTKDKFYWRGKPITAEEYARIEAIIAAKPTPPEGYDFRLNDSLEWEQVKLPPPDPEPMTEDEQKARAYDILMGGAE